MRTNIAIDARLLKEVMHVTGAKTKREAVELALTTLLHRRQQEDIRRFRGKLSWSGDLGVMRVDA